MEPKIIPVKDFQEGDELGRPQLDERGNIKFPRKSEQKKGRTSRASGAKFELKAREDLEEKQWTVAKWSNNVDLEKQKVISAKKNWKFNPFRKIMMPSAQGTGFPDFIAFQLLDANKYQVIGVEVKSAGYLDKIEKEKCRFLLDKKVFSQILIAKKKQIGGKIQIEYVDFAEKYLKN